MFILWLDQNGYIIIFQHIMLLAYNANVATLKTLKSGGRYAFTEEMLGFEFYLAFSLLIVVVSFICLQKCERLTLLILSNVLSSPFHEPVSPLVSLCVLTIQFQWSFSHLPFMFHLPFRRTVVPWGALLLFLSVQTHFGCCICQGFGFPRGGLILNKVTFIFCFIFLLHFFLIKA